MVFTASCIPARGYLCFLNRRLMIFVVPALAFRMISENFSDFTRFVLQYRDTCSMISFFKSSTARFFTFMRASSFKNWGSNRENFVCMSENRSMTPPSRLILCCNKALIRTLIFGSDSLFPSFLYAFAQLSDIVSLTNDFMSSIFTP